QGPERGGPRARPLRDRRRREAAAGHAGPEARTGPFASDPHLRRAARALGGLAAEVVAPLRHGRLRGFHGRRPSRRIAHGGGTRGDEGRAARPAFTASVADGEASGGSAITARSAP